MAPTYRILIVDDNEAAAEGLGKLLTHRGHLTHIAYTGRAALADASSFNPNVVILDIGLPDMDGYDIAAKLKEQHPGATFLAITGYGREDDRLRAKEAGFDVHLTKPVGLREIEDALAQQALTA